MMLNSGRLLKSALVALVLVAVVESGTVQKLATCCTSVSKEEIPEPVKGYLIQEANSPCVNAVIFQTEKGLYCSALKAPWVRNKIKELRQAKAKSSSPSVVPTSPVSLLSIITSTSSTPSSTSSTPSSTSSTPSSTSSTSSSTSSTPSSAFLSSSGPVRVEAESFSESKDE